MSVGNKFVLLKKKLFCLKCYITAAAFSQFFLIIKETLEIILVTVVVTTKLKFLIGSLNCKSFGKLSVNYALVDGACELNNTTWNLIRFLFLHVPMRYLKRENR